MLMLGQSDCRHTLSHLTWDQVYSNVYQTTFHVFVSFCACLYVIPVHGSDLLHPQVLMKMCFLLSSYQSADFSNQTVYFKYVSRNKKDYSSSSSSGLFTAFLMC